MLQNKLHFFVARFTVALATWLDLQRNCAVQVYNHKINTDNCCNHAICWCFTCKLPLGQYWNKIHMLGVSTHAPINWVKLSWRMSRIWKDMKRIGYQKEAYSIQSDKVCCKTTLSKVEIMIAFESYISNLC